VNRWQL